MSDHEDGHDHSGDYTERFVVKRVPNPEVPSGSLEGRYGDYEVFYSPDGPSQRPALDGDPPFDLMENGNLRVKLFPSENTYVLYHLDGQCETPMLSWKTGRTGVKKTYLYLKDGAEVGIGPADPIGN